MEFVGLSSMDKRGSVLLAQLFTTVALAPYEMFFHDHVFCLKPFMKLQSKS